jgi:DNA-directed RNA polymerase specialized sigma24 family protein
MDLMLPVLKILADGESHGKKEIDRAVAAEFGVTESEMREKISCGANKFKNRMGWALINLKNKNLIIKEGKEYRITDTGSQAVKAAPERLTAKFVKSVTKSGSDSDGNTPEGGTGDEFIPHAEDSADTAENSVEPPAEDAGGDTGAGDTAEAAPPEAKEDSSVDLSAYAGLDPDTEFMLAVKAKAGDKRAFKNLWEKYKLMMAGMFRYCKNLTFEERISESALVFVRKLELFQPDRIGKPPEAWTFSYMLTGGVKNARDKIIRHSKKDAEKDLVFSEAASDYDDIPANSSIMGNTLSVALDVNRYEYEEKYSPEIHAMRASDTPLEEKEKEFLNKLSPLQITILQLRRAGKTVQEIADEMGCGFTKVRLNIVKARQLASSIFEVEYC